jgi:hypothetical protein
MYERILESPCLNEATPYWMNVVALNFVRGVLTKFNSTEFFLYHPCSKLKHVLTAQPYFFIAFLYFYLPNQSFRINLVPSWMQSRSKNVFAQTLKLELRTSFRVIYTLSSHAVLLSRQYSPSIKLNFMKACKRNVYMCTFPNTSYLNPSTEGKDIISFFWIFHL